MKKAFIVSTGRTGTQFLAKFFSDNFDFVKSVHEPFPSRRFRILSNMYNEGKVDKKHLISIFKLSRKQLFDDKNSIECYIESNNFLYGYSGILNEMMEDAKIIHIVRDPRDYIKSHLNHGVFKGKKLIAKKLVPYWFMDVRKILRIKKKLNEYEILAGRWVIVNEFIEKNNKDNKNYKLFKYEDLFGENRNKVFYELAEFLDLPANSIKFKNNYEKINSGSQNVVQSWKSWKVEDLDNIYSICGGLMKKYSYKIN